MKEVTLKLLDTLQAFGTSPWFWLGLVIVAGLLTTDELTHMLSDLKPCIGS